MNSFFITALHQYGYPALWAIIFLAAIGAPISGNLLLYAAGAFAAFDDFNLFVLFIVAVSAAVMGDCVGYFIGWKLGNPLLVWLEKKKRWRFVSLNALARGRTYFRQRAAWAVFISRFFLVVLGGPINWFAGAERYPFRRFLVWDVSGQILGAIIPLSIGYVFAESWGEAEGILGAFSSVVLALLATLWVSMALVRKIRARKRVSASEQEGVLQEEEIYSVGEGDTLIADAQDLNDDEKMKNENAAEKMVNPTILILISRSGGGHLNLAQALQGELGESYNVLIMDPQSALVERGYTLVSRRFVKLLTWQFIWTDNKIAAWLLQNMLALLSRERFRLLIEKTQPQLIITTHALVSYIAARANEQSVKRVPLVFQLTDLERLHMTWFVEKHADAYLAPTREIFAQALKQGIDKDRLYLTGRPVRRQFLPTVPYCKEEALLALGLDPAIFTVFLQGGAKGSAAIDHMIAGILALNMPVQIILAAGNNQEMVERYTGVERIRVLPFTEDIASAMAAADVIAGKAGASFITEAFMLEKPFLVTALIAGQET
ncbi:MAG TPA: VTT domain-containing protein, partial [Ktedonobacteraceae bacterium]